MPNQHTTAMWYLKGIGAHRIRCLPSWHRVDHCLAPPAAERTRRSNKATQSRRMSKRRSIRCDRPPARRKPFDMRRACVPDGSMDVGSLEGHALTRWYLRSPAEIEREREDAAAKRYQDFFSRLSGADPDAGFSGETPAADREVDYDFAGTLPATSQDVDPGFTSAQVGPNRFRSVSLTSDDHSGDPSPLGAPSYGAATPSGNPATIAQEQDAGLPEISASQLDLAPQPVTQFDGPRSGPG
jgi:hypothetical protein